MMTGGMMTMMMAMMTGGDDNDGDRVGDNNDETQIRIQSLNSPALGLSGPQREEGQPGSLGEGPELPPWRSSLDRDTLM